MSNFLNNIVSCITMGGIGNNLFQIANAYSYSLEHNKKFLLFEDKHYEAYHADISIYKNNILNNIEFVKNSNNITFNSYNEPRHQYSAIPHIHNNVLFFGYYQSDKYFIKYIEETKRLFSFTCTIPQIYSDFINNENTCSIHVRRGDYVNLQDHHPLQPVSYYQKAISIIGKNLYYLVFSNDIEWCKLNLTKDTLGIKNIIYIENTKPYQDLLLMQRCKNNIVANSSFSWWGAWLNSNENKKVIAPNIWFGPAYKDYNSSDNYCNEWIII